MEPITAAVSAELKSMLHLNKTNPHHESGYARTIRDANMVSKVMAAMDANPFMARMSDLINAVTGACADPDVKNQLLSVKEIGSKVPSDAILGNQKRQQL